MCEIEIWKDIPNYEGHYQVSNLGRVKSLPRFDRRGRAWGGIILANRPSGKGYLQVGLYIDQIGFHIKIHRLVMNVFIGKSDYEVDHIDGDTKNNRLSNLRYITHRENIARGKRSDQNKNKSVSSRGVTARGDEFEAWKMIDKKLKYLGKYKTEEMASKAYILGEKLYSDRRRNGA